MVTECARRNPCAQRCILFSFSVRNLIIVYYYIRAEEEEEEKPFASVFPFTEYNILYYELRAAARTRVVAEERLP